MTMHSVLGLLLLSATILAECPDGWEKHGHNCYKVTDDPNVDSLDKHLANCRRQGGSLASIHSQEQQDFIE
ncbi:C-type lectin domain family 4member b1 isoform 2, partial [Aphelenchoides avenae]